ncbi:flagellar hook-length control protein FliK [Marinobacter sp. X15-166B]|uniref:flagellar hook-length control protein FliK n=1 Tax=Marinobacter sp. X15-166B TaxID=1897620 RepID=UPI00085C9898|nr:flagellar hook-length control protein FliK [Marinobacter sp. X15-166B]OEY67072.1 hypothetical protein BG841_11800 [Marinobacter sp. X15-166B]
MPPATGLAETTGAGADDASAGFTFAALQAWVSPLPGSGAGGVTGESATGSALLSPALAAGAQSGPAAVLGADPGLTQALQNFLEGQGADSGSFAELEARTPAARVAPGASSLTSVASHKLPEATPVLRAYTTSVELPVGHQQWGEQVVGKLTWLAANKLTAAEIHLTPPDMGPMEVRVQVQQDQAHISMHSANQAVRDQLEQNSHRLRDMLSEQGMELSGFDVTDSSANQSGEEPDAQGQSSGSVVAAATGQDDEDLAATATSIDLGWTGAIDLYA